MTNSLYYGTIPLDVPYKEKNEVNRMGAYYNAKLCTWELKPNFVVNVNPKDFCRWLPSNFDVLDFVRDPPRDRKLSSYPRSPNAKYIPCYASPQNRTKKRSYDDYCPFSEQSSKSRKLTPTEGKKQPGDFIQHKVIIDLTQSSDDEDGIIVHYDD